MVSVTVKRFNVEQMKSNFEKNNSSINKFNFLTSDVTIVLAKVS